MKSEFENYQNTGLISTINMLQKEEPSAMSLLHPKTSDVIIYKDGHYIEMLKDGNFLYRPTGVGRGKRSKDLQKVEEFMFSFLYVGYEDN